jgi:hypothetical protein
MNNNNGECRVPRIACIRHCMRARNVHPPWAKSPTTSENAKNPSLPKYSRVATPSSLLPGPGSQVQLPVPKFAKVHNDSQGGWVRFTKNANTPHNFTIVSKMPQKATGTSTRSTMGSQTLTNGHQKSTKNSQRVHSSHQASGNPQQNARQTSTNVDSKQQTISTNNITNQLPHSVPALAAS